MNWFIDWLKAPVFQNDAKKTQRAYLLNSVLLSILLFLCILIVAIFLGGKTPIATLIIDLLMSVLIFLFRYWLRQGKVAIVGAILMIMGFVYVTSINISLGTIRTPSTASYLFFVICTGVVFDWPGLLASTLASSLAVLGLILAENAGFLPTPDYSVTITQWFTYTALFGLTAGLVYQTNQNTRKALLQAEAEIEERKRFEVELQLSEARYRSLFEQTHDAVFLLTLDGKYLTANQRAADMFGSPLDELKVFEIGRAHV